MAVKPMPMASEGPKYPKTKKNSSKTHFPSQRYRHLKFLQSTPRKTPANCSGGPDKSAKYGAAAKFGATAKKTASLNAVVLTTHVIGCLGLHAGGLLAIMDKLPVLGRGHMKGGLAPFGFRPTQF